MIKKLFYLVSILLFSGCASESEVASFFPFHPLETEWPLVYSSVVTAVTAGADGDLYTAGSCGSSPDLNPGVGEDIKSCSYYISKIDKSDGYQWSKTFSYVTSTMSSDSAGNIYISGYRYFTTDFDPSSGTDTKNSVTGIPAPFISKFDKDFNYQWTYGAYGVASGYAYPQSITVDSSGNSYITGYFSGTNFNFQEDGSSDLKTSSGSTDIFITKVNSSGSYEWTQTIGSTGADTGTGIVADSSNNVVISGNFTGTVDFDPSGSTANQTAAGSQDTFILKLDSSGNYVWAIAYGTTGYELVATVDVDASDNIYTSGYNGASTDMDPGAGTATISSGGYVAKYNSSGGYEWASSICYASPNLTTVYETSVYVSGTFSGTCNFGTVTKVGIGTTDTFVATFSSSDGTNQNATVYTGTITGDYVYSRSMDVDSSGNLYLGGYFSNGVDFYPDSEDNEYGKLDKSGSNGYFIRVNYLQ